MAISAGDVLRHRPNLRRPATAIAVAILAGTIFAGPVEAAVTHTVQPGETLSGIASANGLSTESLAAWNGVSSDYLVISGASISVPATSEVGSTVTTTTATATSTAPASWLGSIPSPWGDLYLDAGGASAWNEMRAQAMSDYGVDIYPAGPLSAYRTSTQQGEMYEMFLDGTGAPANPPGYSSHELGVSVDLATPAMRDVVDQIGWQYGWGKTEAPTEWWHVSWTGY